MIYYESGQVPTHSYGGILLYTVYMLHLKQIAISLFDFLHATVAPRAFEAFNMYINMKKYCNVDRTGLHSTHGYALIPTSRTAALSLHK